MFKKHIIFQILYIIVGPLCPASLKCFFSTKSLFPTSCSDWPTGTVHCDWPNTASTHRKCNAPFHNRSFSFQNESNVVSFTISSSPRGEQSRMTDTVMKLVCVCKQAAIKRLTCCDVTLSLSLSLSLTHTRTHTVNSKYLN